MAYMDFTGLSATLAPGAASVAPAATTAARFSPLEWTTILLARTDGLASLREPGRLSRALGSLFGLGTKTRLSDPALEALRRLAVNAWHYGYALPVSEMAAFLSAGFSNAQLDLALASIAKGRDGRRGDRA